MFPAAISLLTLKMCIYIFHPCRRFLLLCIQSVKTSYLLIYAKNIYKKVTFKRIVKFVIVNLYIFFLKERIYLGHWKYVVSLAELRLSESGLLVFVSGTVRLSVSERLR